MVPFLTMSLEWLIPSPDPYAVQRTVTPIVSTKTQQSRVTVSESSPEQALKVPLMLNSEHMAPYPEWMEHVPYPLHTKSLTFFRFNAGDEALAYFYLVYFQQECGVRAAVEALSFKEFRYSLMGRTLIWYDNFAWRSIAYDKPMRKARTEWPINEWITCFALPDKWINELFFSFHLLFGEYQCLPFNWFSLDERDLYPTN